MGECKIKYNFAPEAKPIDFFIVIMNIISLESIVTETNRYMEKLSQIHQKGWVSVLKPIIIDELKMFLGLVMLMGGNSMNRIQDYWRTYHMYNFPFFRELRPLPVYFEVPAFQ